MQQKRAGSLNFSQNPPIHYESYQRLSESSISTTKAISALRRKSANDVENGGYWLENDNDIPVTQIRRSSKRKTSSIKKEFEVIVPMTEDGIGQFDRSVFIENINNNTPSMEDEFEGFELLNYGSEVSMSFYTKGHPVCVVRNLSGLKGNKIIPEIENHVFWLDISGYDEPTLIRLAKIFSIHPLTVEDILTEESREKCELYSDYIFICFRALPPNHDPTEDAVVVVYIICTQKYVISFHKEELENVSKIHQRLERVPDLELAPGWILYMILDSIVDSFIPVVDGLDFEMKSIEDLVLLLHGAEQSELLQRIENVRKTVAALQKQMMWKGEIVKSLRNHHQKFEKSILGPELGIYFEDIISHGAAMDYDLTNFMDGLNQAHSNYLARVSIELTQASNNMGITMKKFSVGACIFLPLNLIAAVMGMNVRVPGNVDTDEDNLFWFYYILALMLIISIILMLFARWRDML